MAKSIEDIERGLTILEHAIDYLSTNLTGEFDPLDEPLAILDRCHDALCREIDETI